MHNPRSLYPFKLEGQDQPFYILNCVNLEEIAPRSFHSTKDSYRSDRLNQIETGNLHYFDENAQLQPFSTLPSREGLEDLNVSGSAQFTYQGFQWILNEISQRGGDLSSLINVDLREEYHCFFKGAPISYYIPGNCLNFGHKNDHIRQQEHQWIEDLKQESFITIEKVIEKQDGLLKSTDQLTYPLENPDEISSEQKFIEEEQGIEYVRIPIGDHTKPTPEDVEEILSFFKRIHPSQWVHFHCAGGKGRTTTLMLLYDIFCNYQRYPHLKLIDYVLRHYLIGGINLFTYPHISWKSEAALARAQFIRDFYQKLVKF